MKTFYTLILSIITTFSLVAQSPSYDSLNINNINARFYSAGQMFQDTSTSNPAYELVQGSGQHTIYAGNLWFGGRDVNGQLKLAGQTYTTGDFYYGPVAMNTSTGNQANYDYVWKVSKQEIDDFIAWYQCSNTPGCTPPPGYSIPSVILNWPAHGDISLGHDYYIAPFVDYNQDGIYNPLDGDYPCIKGDMAIFQIFHDYGIHTASGADLIGLEVRAMHYGYDHDPTALGNDSSFLNTIFSEYLVINRSTQQLNDFYVGLWEDMDIGCSDDDYIGCDVSRGLAYTYNGTTTDNVGCFGSLSFANNTPAQGVTILKGIKQDADGMDNPLTTDVPTAISQNGIPYDALGCNYGDNSADNEYMGLTGFIYFNDDGLPPSTYGNPVTPFDYYDYLNGFWKDSTQMVHGGTGHQSSAGATTTVSNYAYSGDSDPLFWSTSGVAVTPADWSEANGPNPVGDRKSLAIMGPVTLSYLDTYTFSLAHITGQSASGTGNGLNELFAFTDEIRDFYACDENIFESSCSQYTVSIKEEDRHQDITLYPNPTNSLITFKTDHLVDQIKVYSITGELLLNLSESVQSIDLSGFDAGVYFVELMIDGSRVVKQVVKE